MARGSFPPGAIVKTRMATQSFFCMGSYISELGPHCKHFTAFTEAHPSSLTFSYYQVFAGKAASCFTEKLLFDTSRYPRCFVCAVGCLRCALCVNQGEMWILVVQTHNFQQNFFFLDITLRRRFLGELCAMNVCASVSAVTEPPTLGREKPFDFYCLGNKRTKLFYRHHISSHWERKAGTMVRSHDFKTVEGGGGSSAGNFTIHLEIWTSWIYWFCFCLFFCHEVCERKRIFFFFYMQFYVSVHIFSHPSWDPSGIHHLLGWCKSGQGMVCWFKSCPCTSSGGARDLFYSKAKIVEGQASEVWSPFL